MSEQPRSAPSQHPPSSRPASAQIPWASASAQGSGRRNEDVAAGYPDFPEDGLFVVADGGSTHAWGGAGLSGLAIAAVRAYFEGVYPDQVGSGEVRLERGMLAAHHCLRHVLDLTFPFAIVQMAALSLGRESVHLAHVGTCRIHRIRGQACQLLTADHAIDVGNGRRGVTRSLDMPDVAVSLQTEEKRSGDIYLLSTVGIHGGLSPSTLGEIITSARGPESAVRALVEAARVTGTRYDATCVVLRVP